MSDDYITIEVISERVGVPRTTILRYARLGLVEPRARHGRAPLFSPADAARVRKIARLTRDLGINLAGVDVILRLTDEIERLRDQLARE